MIPHRHALLAASSEDAKIKILPLTPDDHFSHSSPWMISLLALHKVHISTPEGRLSSLRILPNIIQLPVTVLSTVSDSISERFSFSRDRLRSLMRSGLIVSCSKPVERKIVVVTCMNTMKIVFIVVQAVNTSCDHPCRNGMKDLCILPRRSRKVGSELDTCGI